MPVSYESIKWNQALCLNVSGKEKDQFHVDQWRGAGKTYAVEATQRAKAICGWCPILVECLEYALDHSGLEGVYGATTTYERRAIRKRRRRAAS